jgi:hypothetical protein
MARHVVLHSLGYLSNQLDMVNTRFQYVRLTIEISSLKNIISWNYSYLGSYYASYHWYQRINLHIFTNGNMQIGIYRDSANYLIKTPEYLALYICSIVCIVNTPADLNDQYAEISKHFNELLPMNFADPIDCYWKIVNFAKKHKLAI